MFEKRSISAALLLVASVPACWILAGPGDDAPRTDVPGTDVAFSAAEGAADESTLGWTIQLQFKLLGPEETRTFAVVCAAREYSLKHDIADPNHEHLLQIEGKLAPADAAGRILLTFKAQNAHSDLNEGFDASFSAAGSAIVAPGQEIKLADLGDAPLLVTAIKEEKAVPSAR